MSTEEGGERPMGRLRIDGRYSQWLSSLRENMTKLEILAKKFLDKDIKILVKHKLLNKDLSVTDEGLEFLVAFLFAEYKAPLAAELRKQLKEDEGEEEEVSLKKKK
jgi:hypothetical protein